MPSAIFEFTSTRQRFRNTGREFPLPVGVCARNGPFSRGDTREGNVSIFLSDVKRWIEQVRSARLSFQVPVTGTSHAMSCCAFSDPRSPADVRHGRQTMLRNDEPCGSDVAQYPSYATAYEARYAHTITGCETIGSTGASLMSFQRAPGDYPESATSDFALLMVQNGGFTGELDLGAGRFRASVRSGQLFLTPPFTATEKSFHGPVKAAVLAITHSRLAEVLRGTDISPHNGYRELYTRPLADDFIRTAVNQLLTIMHSKLAQDSLFADLAVVTIFAAIARHALRDRPLKAGRGLARWQVRRVMEKLELLENVSLAELATAVNLSPYYFARAFKHTTGVAPHRYQLRLRIDRAKELLRDTQLSVTEVALRVGYGSSQTLAREFRKEVGISPVRYRCDSSV